jgi:hypothetical protein
MFSVIPRDLICYDDDNLPHFEKKACRLFIFFITIPWTFEWAEFINLNCDIGWWKCCIGLKIGVKDVKDLFANDLWWSWTILSVKDQIEGGQISHDGGNELE